MCYQSVAPASVATIHSLSKPDATAQVHVPQSCCKVMELDTYHGYQRTTNFNQEYPPDNPCTYHLMCPCNRYSQLHSHVIVYLYSAVLHNAAQLVCQLAFVTNIILCFYITILRTGCKVCTCCFDVSTAKGVFRLALASFTGLHRKDYQLLAHAQNY